MFGYVRLHKPTITMGEYEQYQGIYCTLCKRMGKRYGLLSRFTLSYDMTFFALLYMALEEAGPDFCPGRCSFNPTKKCLKAQNTLATDLAADIGTLLAYYKLKDTLADEGFGKRLGAGLMLPFMAAARKKAARRRPDTDRLVAEMMRRQAQLEADRCASIDRAAEPFALMLQALAADIATDERQQQVLGRFGYCLGRWIYLIDGVDDLTDDLQKGRYNPYIYARGLKPGEDVSDTRTYAVHTLNACLAECVAAYNLLDIRRFDGILRNILEQGMPHAQRRAVSGEEQKHEQRSL
ncbi:MAG: hypothetical protein IJ518_07250 [Clostridia bacterium]|nr:hypothetical protein [Clostridia bacterium]